MGLEWGGGGRTQGGHDPFLAISTTPLYHTVLNLNFPPFLCQVPGASLLIPSTPKSCLHSSRHSKTLVTPSPPCLNPILAIPTAPVYCTTRNLNFPPFLHTVPGASLLIPGTPKSCFCPSRHAKTLVTPSPPRQNTVLAIPTTPVHCTVLSLNFPPFFRQTLTDRADSGDKRQDIWSDHTLKVSARSGQGAGTSLISNRWTDGQTDGQTACETPHSILEMGHSPSIQPKMLCHRIQ